MIIPTAVENFAPLLHVDALPVVARELSRSARRQLDQLHLDQGGEQHQLHLHQDGKIYYTWIKVFILIQTIKKSPSFSWHLKGLVLM